MVNTLSRLIGTAPGYVRFEEGSKISKSLFVDTRIHTNPGSRGRSTEALWYAFSNSR